MQEEATLTSKGQVTIPKQIREHFGLKEGNKIVFIEKANEIVIRPKIENALQKLKELRKTMKIDESEIDKMIEESKKDWS
ncbi:MAG: AbrB/MazE/SpoVT family DNA-binding domain-containing protein [Candidatus Aenigmarchaeota archaeon]|nr:AbrB/MazE/SpoVT family DNA-binding domain-containing protein [Candidatus Aenigmarchaeota archaeon]